MSKTDQVLYNHDRRGGLIKTPDGSSPVGSNKDGRIKELEFLERWGARVRVAISAHFEGQVPEFADSPRPKVGGELGTTASLRHRVGTCIQQRSSLVGGAGRLGHFS